MVGLNMEEETVIIQALPVTLYSVSLFQGMPPIIRETRIKVTSATKCQSLNPDTR